VVSHQVPPGGDREPSFSDVHLSTSRPWALVAEDDLEMLWLLSRALRSEGFDVIEAKSGVELFNTLRHAREGDALPSLVVSDIQMPGMTGLQVASRLGFWGISVPLVLITAFPDDETLEAAAQAGIAVLSKPFDLEDLRKVARWLTMNLDAPLVR